MVDGDLSGGPLIATFETNVVDLMGVWETFMTLQSAHAQNYHIFTPAEGKDWCMFWGPQQWVKELPYANHACSYNFRPGQPGHLVLEFWITPFDYAGAEGPNRAVESDLKENKIIGLAWAVIEYDNANSGGANNGFWNLSRHHRMYGNADYLCPFKLMPLEPQFLKPLDAKWSFPSWTWTGVWSPSRTSPSAKSPPGNGNSATAKPPPIKTPSTLTNGPVPEVVVLTVAGTDGATNRFSRVWDVTLK